MLSKKDIVAEALLREIREGKILPGDFSPSRSQLMRRFRCSRTVIEGAVAELTALGYLSGRQGKGTSVNFHREHPGKVKRISVVSPYDAKSFQSPFTCLLLNSGELELPVKMIGVEHADAEFSSLCDPENVTIFINPGYELLPLMECLRARRRPLLVVNREYDGFDRVYTDMLAGFREGLAWLEPLSDTPLSLISRTAQLRYPYQAPRMLAFYRACAEMNLPLPEERCLIAPFAHIGREMLRAEKLFDRLPAKLCILNSDLLLPLMEFASAAGLRPGREFHLLAFEYSSSAANIPGIAMIRQRYDLFYRELLRFLRVCDQPDRPPFIRAIPPEIMKSS